MKKVLSYIFISGVFSISSLHAEDIIELATNFSIETHCAVNAEVYSSCFHLNETQCRDILSSIVLVCNQAANEFPLSGADSQAETAFMECVSDAFESHLVSMGIDLDAPC